MANLFGQSEKNLGRAGWALLLEFSAAIGGSLALDNFSSIPSDFAVLALWAVNPIAAWFLANAARAQGRSRLTFGIPALLPPIAIAVFVILYNRDATLRYFQGSGRGRGA